MVKFVIIYGEIQFKLAAKQVAIISFTLLLDFSKLLIIKNFRLPLVRKKGLLFWCIGLHLEIGTLSRSIFERNKANF